MFVWGQGEKMTTKQFREDLKEIRYYYSIKDDMDMAMEYVDNSKIRDILNRYNAVMKMARMRIYTILTYYYKEYIIFLP